MTPGQFEDHKAKNVHLVFELTNSKSIAIEKSWTDEYGIYSIVKRDYYLKSPL